MITINSNADLQKRLEGKEKAFVLIHKSGSELSECALESIRQSEEVLGDESVFLVDVSTVRDVHPNYGISSVPSLLVIDHGQFTNVIKGCMDVQFYKSFFSNTLHTASATKEGKRIPKVVLYSTPTCSWCRTIKSYFNKNNIRYREIDVSRDEKAAQEMVRKSGQQGVPQTEIDGQIVVGFDQKKIDRLLGIGVH